MRKLACLLLLTSIGSTTAALAQTEPSAPSAKDDLAAQAVLSLERWRESRVSTFMNDFAELNRYQSANAQLDPVKAGENRVIFFGDSITDVWKLDEYFPGKDYINRGISGQTTPQMLIRFRQDVIDLSPKVVVILAGTNDIAGNTGPMTAEETESNFASMAELARQHSIHVVFASITPIHNYAKQRQSFFLQRSPEEITQLNQWLRNYCDENKLVYLDYYSAMVDDRGMMKAALADDGLHPNDAGYRIMTPLADEAIRKALAQ